MARRDVAHENLIDLLVRGIQVRFPDALVRDRRKKTRKCACGKLVWFDPGPTGSADIWVVLAGGLHVEVEAKTGTGRLEPEQKNWRLWCEIRRIPYVLVSSERTDIASLTAAAASAVERIALFGVSHGAATTGPTAAETQGRSEEDAREAAGEGEDGGPCHEGECGCGREPGTPGS